MIPEFHKRGGTERCVASLAEALAARGHGVTVFSSMKETSLLPEAAWRRVPIVARPHLARFLSFLVVSAVVRATSRILRRERFDVVHSTGPDVLRPTVSTFHCCAPTVADGLRQEAARRRPGGRRSRLRRRSNILAYRVIALFERYVVGAGARRVIAVSPGLARELDGAYRPRKGRVVVIPNGVALDEFRPATWAERRALRMELGLPEARPVLLFVGHNWERKGLGVLVRALELLARRDSGPPPCLVVVGGGDRAYEESVRARLDGDVRFTGTRADLPRLYMAADLCVLPSTQDAFGLPVLEAMAVGLPAIVSRCAGVAELIADGVDGILLDDPRSPEELADKVGRVVRDPDFRRRIGAEARTTAERYSWGGIAARVEALYREVLKEPAGR